MSNLCHRLPLRAAAGGASVDPGLGVAPGDGLPSSGLAPRPLLPGAAHDAAHASLLTVLDINLLYLHLGLGPLILTTLTRLTSPGKHLDNKGNIVCLFPGV